ncbi:hypothetical protein N7893_000351 [Vibrio vulnificus]|nr:hypothetical protein [Vibrio vulnificus]
MSALNRINNSVVGSKGIVKQLGWIGDSICVADYFGPTGTGASNQKYSFASIVSSYYGAYANNQGESGRVLSSFLPYLSGPVVGAEAQFDGQWLNDNGSWYWWNPSLNDWVSVPDTGSSVNRNGTSVTKLTNLLGNSAVRHVFIAQSGVNDNRSNLDSGAGDSGAHGSYHYSLLLNEIIARIQSAGKIAILITGTTAADPVFHGTSAGLRQEEIGRYSEASRQSAIKKGVQCCDVGLRLNIELSLGRVDILCRNSQNKPTALSQSEWDEYLSGTGDPNASVNPYRSFDESEDYLHVNDTYRASYFHNVHPNPFGHYLIANEILKFIGENGLR